MTESTQQDGRQPYIKPSLESLLNIYPIRHRLIQYLRLRDLLGLYRTSWNIRLNLKENDWNINQSLLRFFKNPMAFRSCLGHADALISGSFALQFFERVVWPNSGLDIMVRDGRDLKTLGKYLVESEGYTMNHEAGGWEEYIKSDIMRVSSIIWSLHRILVRADVLYRSKPIFAAARI